MNKYKIVAYVNGTRTEAVISAWDTGSARKLFEAQYAGCRINIQSVQRV